MSSSFFIRGKPKTGSDQNARRPGKTKRKGIVYGDQSVKKRKKSKNVSANFKDEEISSEEDEVYEKRKHAEVETDEEEFVTPQEKKLKLAKKYLKEIEEEEKKKNDLEEVDNEVILGRLKEDVLIQAGKFRRKVSDKIRTEFEPTNFKVLKCKEHKLSVSCLAISSDNFIYSGSKDCTIVKWSLNDLKKVASIPPRHKNKSNETLHNSTILCLAVSHDNKYLASGDEGNVIQMWDPKNLTHLFSFKGHRAGVTGLGFCRLTQNLYSCSRDRTVKVWSVLERAYIETLFGHQTPITELDVLSKNRVVTSGGTDNSIRVWKIDEEAQLIYNAHERSVDCVRRLDDQHFVSCGDNGSLCLWGANKKKPLFTTNPAHGIDESSGEPYWLTSIGCLSNTEIFASGSCEGHVKMWKCDDNYKGASVLATIPVTGFVNAISFTTDQKHLVVGVGQEHKLGRWSRIKEAKNSILVINMEKPD